MGDPDPERFHEKLNVTSAVLNTMRMKNAGVRAAVIILVSLVLIVMVFVPIIPGRWAACTSPFLCIPDQRQSVTRYFLGFGGESSYGGEFYDVAPDYLVPALIAAGALVVGGIILMALVRDASRNVTDAHQPSS